MHGPGGGKGGGGGAGRTGISGSTVAAAVAVPAEGGYQQTAPSQVLRLIAAGLTQATGWYVRTWLS